MAQSAGFDARTLRHLAHLIAERSEGFDGFGMSISAESVSFDEDAMWVTLSDGRVLGVPLAWFPRLLHASAQARAGVTLPPSVCIGRRRTRTPRFSACWRSGGSGEGGESGVSEVSAMRP